MKRKLILSFLVVLISFLGACAEKKKEQKVIFEVKSYTYGGGSLNLNALYRQYCPNTFKERLTDYTADGWRIVSFSEKSYPGPQVGVTTGKCLGTEFVLEK
jgi:hypothetical protein